MDTVLRDNIDWVGYVDWAVRDFHGYHTQRGSTYNAYLIRDEKTALIDTVKAPFVCELMQNIQELTPLDQVDYIVCNHAETDHAGGLADVLKACPNAELVCNKKCRDILSKHFNTKNWKFHIVGDGETLSLGKRSLTFVNTPMVHWPESMMTYVPEEKILFSMDAFGQHLATSQRFDDEADLAIVLQEAKTYYANIVMPYGKMVAKTLDKASSLDIEMLATAHGVIWRKHVGEIVECYQAWAHCRPACKVLVVYDSMWGSTSQMADAIVKGASQSDVQVKLIPVRASNITILATEMLDAAAVAFGSATLNRTMMPEMAGLTNYLKGLDPFGKAGFSFGSYGWSKGGAEDLQDEMQAMKMEILRDPIITQYVPDMAVLEECRKAGAELAEKARQLASQAG